MARKILTWYPEKADPENADPMSWYNAVEYCKELGKGWRLPTVEELFSLVDFSLFNPATKENGIMSSSYWSSTTYADTTYADYPNYAWYVNFYYGGVNYNYKSSSYYVRAVRGGLK